MVAPCLEGLRPVDFHREAHLPAISSFFGIAIYVYYAEHPPPHFHAVYGEYEASISIGDLVLLRGTLPPRALGLVMEWAARYQDELMLVWRQARDKRPLSKIAPLE
jgi:hypothetical protein